MINQAIILAAGKGSRLSKYTHNVPKALLPIKYGKTILERMLEQLIKNNIDNIIIVLGYQEANSNLYIKELSKTCNELNIITVNNLDYATTGTLKSLLIGLGEISNSKGDVLIVEGDVVCEDSIFQDILSERKNILAVDSSSKLGEEEMKYVISDSDTIHKISKELCIEDAHGEYTGILRLLESDINNFISIGEEKYKKNNLAFYESIIDSGKIIFNYLDVFPKKWTEVDFPLEYKKARQIFSDEKKISIDYSLFAETSHSPSLFSLIDDPDVKIKDFCFLANPYLLDEKFINNIYIELKQLIGSYPPTQKQLAIKLSQYHLNNIHPDNIIIGNGATELINIINYWSNGSIVPIPTFSEYTDSVGELLKYPLDKKNDYNLDIDHFIKFCKDQSSDKYPNIILINPNNPVGNVISRDKIIRSLVELDQFNIIVDESFLDFFHPSESVLDIINEFQNLIVIKSYGKTIGMPGVRVGAIYSNIDYIREMRKKIPEWNVNSIAAYILDLMTTKEFRIDLQESLKKIAHDTMELFFTLKKIKNIKVFQPTGNYVLVRLLGDMNSTYLRDQLLSDRIFIRDCSNKMGLDDKFIRIASRTIKENYDISKHIEMVLADYELDYNIV